MFGDPPAPVRSALDLTLSSILRMPLGEFTARLSPVDRSLRVDCTRCRGTGRARGRPCGACRGASQFHLPRGPRGVRAMLELLAMDGLLPVDAFGDPSVRTWHCDDCLRTRVRGVREIEFLPEECRMDVRYLPPGERGTFPVSCGTCADFDGAPTSSEELVRWAALGCWDIALAESYARTLAPEDFAGVAWRVGYASELAVGIILRGSSEADPPSPADAFAAWQTYEEEGPWPEECVAPPSVVGARAEAWRAAVEPFWHALRGLRGLGLVPEGVEAGVVRLAVTR